LSDGARPAGKWLRVRRSLRESRFRVARASKTELLLDVLNATALVYQVWVAVNLGLSRIQTPPTAIHAAHAWVFPVALLFSTLHRVWLKEWFQNPKWAAAEAHRAEALGVAISRLAACSQADTFTGVDAGAIEQGLLGAMLSEVESIVVDTQSIYLNVTLLVEDRADPTRLFCLNRAKLTRDLHTTYPRVGMLAWRAMEDQRLAYEPSFTPPVGAPKPPPYKSILAIPILFRDGSVTTSLGAISIDSAKEGEFDGLEAKIERRLLPYVTLTKLVLVYRRKYNAFL
jgi:hypothetical protein